MYLTLKIVCFEMKCSFGCPLDSATLDSPKSRWPSPPTLQAAVVMIGLNSVIIFFLLIVDSLDLLVDEIRVSNVKLLTECRTNCLVV